MAEKINKEQKVVAEYELTSPDGVEKVKMMGHAWHRAYELPTPVSVKFIGFVRA